MMGKSAESGIPQMMCVALVSATALKINTSLPLNPRVILVITTTIYFKWLREYPNITISHSTYMLLCYPIQLHHHQYQTINGIFWMAQLFPYATSEPWKAHGRMGKSTNADYCTPLSALDAYNYAYYIYNTAICICVYIIIYIHVCDSIFYAIFIYYHRYWYVYP